MRCAAMSEYTEPPKASWGTPPRKSSGNSARLRRPAASGGAARCCAGAAGGEGLSARACCALTEARAARRRGWLPAHRRGAGASPVLRGGGAGGARVSASRRPPPGALVGGRPVRRERPPLGCGAGSDAAGWPRRRGRRAGPSSAGGAPCLRHVAGHGDAPLPAASSTSGSTDQLRHSNVSSTPTDSRSRPTASAAPFARRLRATDSARVVRAGRARAALAFALGLGAAQGFEDVRHGLSC